MGSDYARPLRRSGGLVDSCRKLAELMQFEEGDETFEKDVSR